MAVFEIRDTLNAPTKPLSQDASAPHSRAIRTAHRMGLEILTAEGFPRVSFVNVRSFAWHHNDQDIVSTRRI